MKLIGVSNDCIASPITSITVCITLWISGMCSLIKLVKSLSKGSMESPSGINRPTSSCLPIPAIASEKLSYLISLISSIVAFVLSNSPFRLDRAITVSAPISSHIVP